MAIRYRNGRNSPWIVYWKNPFTGKTEELPCTREDEAKKQNSLIKHRLKYERGSFRPKNSDPEPDQDTLEACYYLYLKEKKFSKKSLSCHQLVSMRLPLKMIGDKAISEIARKDLDAVKQAHINTGINPATVRGRMSVLRAVINWCAEKGFIDQVPIFPKLPPAHYEHFIPPTPSELAKICEVAPPHILRVIYLGSQLGIRVGKSELFKMTWGDVDIDRRVVRVRAAKKRPDQPWREVPIKESLVPVLTEWKRTDDAAGIEFLINYRGKKVTTIQTAWRTMLRNAGFTRRIRPYDLRHSFGTEAIAAGYDVGTVAQIMGNDPKILLAHYQHVSDKRKREAVEGIPDIPNYGKNLRQKN